MLMLSGSVITSGLPPAVGAALSFSPVAAVLGLALIVSVLILACMADGEVHGAGRRTA